MKGYCEICNKNFENIGTHTYQKHKEKTPSHRMMEADEFGRLTEIKKVPNEKPLNDLLSEIKNLLSRYRNTIETKIYEDNGKTKEVTITVKITI